MKSFWWIEEVLDEMKVFALENDMPTTAKLLKNALPEIKNEILNKVIHTGEIRGSNHFRNVSSSRCRNTFRLF